MDLDCVYHGFTEVQLDTRIRGTAQNEVPYHPIEDTGSDVNVWDSASLKRDKMFALGQRCVVRRGKSLSWSPYCRSLPMLHKEAALIVAQHPNIRRILIIFIGV